MTGKEVGTAKNAIESFLRETTSATRCATDRVAFDVTIGATFHAVFGVTFAVRGETKEATWAAVGGIYDESLNEARN